MAWFSECKSCSADWYLWRELLVCRSSQGYAVFLTRGDVAAIDNPPDHVQGWESRFSFARLSSEMDILGIPEQWGEQRHDPIPRSYMRLSASQRWTLTYFRGTALRWHLSREFFHWCESVCFTMVEKGKKRTLKRARPLEEGSISVDSYSSAEDPSELSPIRGSPAADDHLDHKGAPSSRESVLQFGSEGMVPSSVVAQIREELEASRAEVVRLQLMFQGDDIRSSAMVEYLQSAAYRRRVEFERAHHSQSGYVRALADVAALYLEKIALRFSILIEVVGGFSYVVILGVRQRGGPFSGDRASVIPAVALEEMCYQRGCLWRLDSFVLSMRVTDVGEFPVLDRGSPMLAGSRCWIGGRLWQLDSLVLSTGVTYVGGFPMLDRGSPYDG
ncbi:hypothetical protein ACLOJK_039257 [Asimina triloba]